MSSAGLHRSSSAPLKDGIPPKELLDDLCSRFVLNVPKEDQQSFERILFLVEYAHWFYEDNSVENNPSLKSFTLKEFTTLMFSSCDVLKPYVPHIDDIFKDFTSYKVRVPVTGAIILDQTYERCVLVKGWKGTSWSFPRGKKNKDEEDDACAIREVLEETGFNVSKLINKDEYIEIIFGPQRVRLYIVGGVKDDTTFAPQTKKEISEIAWQRLDELQPANRDVISRSVTGLKLYMVAPFLKSLRSWISSHQPPVTPKLDAPARAMSVWKARGSSSGSNLVITETPWVEKEKEKEKGGPGRSFRNFEFNNGPILQAIETGMNLHID
ncbi:mRNA-decapping enzyme subunit 2-like [Cynara cardunculus var. scolymus]|uniref:mRNA decapping protein 2, Box A n=1 Tax=Cynara cardunculus var. scolymus TaxID=59895 RepID=A0A118K427_CYNCS|nr:mRNA-decapping enzyme subunit 2-like [Cynara cardunculus var. scolymus]XP_024969987.1 mRNA-decapping enzyme subunit 2-like [Cynara cardunculus var. scolymus]XP_024969988.1 mRNA-decapping enzyme subunit 2-like [Cynara cardunculus var. scolymus]KVI06886.1 mRNA decapping protein 2, Box A [Cynara cardunculus var. scolymus]